MARLTRKHFRKVASAIAELPRIEDRRNMAADIGDVFQALNPDFDWARWNTACKTSEGDGAQDESGRAWARAHKHAEPF